ncbi:hypothetical protein E3983_11480 [Legionella israelensis]|uniref:Phosphoadenosine phosphosulphate reductase domain-containing protein n=1 Tax=Legionella israelensis TaxID=454 RepID=A0AAX1EIJ6_9GAMM|nr:phosphoadenosine phosphosulfate reductase family protein [Legionella israelensis]QBR84917.1 hypothetical protein E3983_11480 [Legionella israelensis]
MQYFVIGNFGNHSLAALQYLIDRALEELHFIYVDTGWSSASWSQRVKTCTAFAESRGVRVHHLSAAASFSDMVCDRQQFPSQKFQWCAGFLKGLTILNHLDDIDPFCEALIVSGKRRLDSRRYHDLPEYKEDDRYYNGRRIWHPLWQTSDEDFQALIAKTGFDVLSYASQECSPCIHLAEDKLGLLDPLAKTRLDRLEKKLNKTMFEKAIMEYSQESAAGHQKQTGLEQFELSCGSPWCCGE